MFFEHSREVQCVLDANHPADIAYRHVGFEQQHLRLVDPHLIQVLQRRYAHDRFEQRVHMIRCEMDFTSDVLSGQWTIQAVAHPLNDTGNLEIFGAIGFWSLSNLTEVPFKQRAKQ